VGGTAVPLRLDVGLTLLLPHAFLRQARLTISHRLDRADLHVEAELGIWRIISHDAQMPQEYR
jgi:hypothetical protein